VRLNEGQQAAETTAAPAPSARPARLSLLDVLRFLAALAVVGYHFTVKSPAAPAWEGAVPQDLVGFGNWAAYGAMGVTLFFVISGFVILMTAWGRDVPHFVASRIGRLFPGYWVSVVVAAVITVALWPEGLLRGLHKTQILLNLTMMQGAYGIADVDRVYWTLFYEARFYLLIALFMLVGITRQRILALAAIWPVVGALAAGSGPSIITALLMPDYAPFFAGGMLLYVLYRDGHDLVTWLLVGLNGLLAINFATETYTTNLSIDTGFPIHSVVVAFVAVACFGLVALAVLTPLRRLHARWMVVAGSLSYPLYLMHQTTGWYVIHVLHRRTNPWVTIGVATVVALALAVLVHHLVERPLGNRLRAAVLRGLRRNSADPGATTRPERVSPATEVPGPPADPAAPPRRLPDVAPLPHQVHREDAHRAARPHRLPVNGHTTVVRPSDQVLSPTAPAAARAD
jgi:peptidoglycan/LPS O-acetylase OafA/YrhL